MITRDSLQHYFDQLCELARDLTLSDEERAAAAKYRTAVAMALTSLIESSRASEPPLAANVIPLAERPARSARSA